MWVKSSALLLSSSLIFHPALSNSFNIDSEFEISQRNAFRIKQDEELAQNKQIALLKLESSPASFSDITIIARGFNDQYYKKDKFDHVNLDNHEEGFQLREAYSDLYFDNFSVRVGKQQVTWGESDYFRTLDMVNSLDLREFLLAYTEDFQQSRNNLNMVNITHQGDTWESQLLYIPDFKADTLPSASADFAPLSLQQLVSNVGQPNSNTPDTTVKNAAWGISSKASLEFADVGLYAYDGWNSQAVVNIDNTGLNFNYYRRHFFAASISRPIGSWILRSDFAHYPNEKSTAIFTSGLAFHESDMNQFLIGADYNAGSLNFSCQILHKTINNDAGTLLDPKELNSFSIYLSKDFMGDRLSLSHLVLGETDKLNTLNETRLIYRFTDKLKANIGLDWFSGDSDSNYGQFKNQSRVFSGFSYFL